MVYSHQRVICHGCLWGFEGHALCGDCSAAYMIVSPRDADVGDMAELVQVSTVERKPGIDGKIRPATTKEWKPTGIHILITGETISVDDHTIEILRRDITGLCCPDCSGEFVTDFDDDLSCPQCGQAKLRVGKVWVSIV